MSQTGLTDWISPSEQMPEADKFLVFVAGQNLYVGVRHAEYTQYFATRSNYNPHAKRKSKRISLAFFHQNEVLGWVYVPDTPKEVMQWNTTRPD